MSAPAEAFQLPAELPPPAGREVERDLALRNIDNIRGRLANCEDALDAWDIAQASEAVQRAIQARNLGRDIIWEAAEFALRARRRVGELLGEAKHGGDRKGDGSIKFPFGNLMLKPTERHRCRTFAAIAKDRFDAYLIERRERYLDNDDRIITARRALADLAGDRKRSSADGVHPIKPSDNWNFGRVSGWADKIEGGAADEVGYLPGQVYANILFYWTEPGHKVCAPMAGSGMIFQVYDNRDLWMTPEPWDLDIEAFDLVPRGPYEDRIVGSDALVAISSEEPDLIVMDIPYFGMCRGVYSDSPHDLGNMDWRSYVEGLDALGCNCAAAQRAGQRTVVITAARYVDYKAGEVRLLDEAVLGSFHEAGYVIEDKAFSTRRIQQTQTLEMARMNNHARETKRMLSDMLVVLVFRLPPREPADG